VVFESPEAVGIGPIMLCPGALLCRLLLESYKIRPVNNARTDTLNLLNDLEHC
jgi:hypothetical protein